MGMTVTAVCLGSLITGTAALVLLRMLSGEMERKL